MQNLVWIGAAISVIGLIGIIYSVILVVRARRANLDDDALRARIGKVLPINLGALFLSTIGLMTVIVGIILT